MNYTSTGHKPPRGLDDGVKPSSSKTHLNNNYKKRKREHSTTGEGAADAANAAAEDASEKDIITEIPKILPGERMGDYAARVDQALPVMGLVGKGVGERRTKMERKMQRMQREWREVEARRVERIKE
ncbi:MAG: hypothetical protein Q9223_007543, partial [Gallowayella weberi]